MQKHLKAGFIAAIAAGLILQGQLWAQTVSNHREPEISGVAKTLKSSGDPEELRARVACLARLGEALRKLKEIKQNEAQ